MIEILLFALCIPVELNHQVVDYDCSWEIVYAEFQGMMRYLWEYHSQGTEWEKDHVNLLGLTIHETRTIYLWKGHEGDYAMLGCNTLWHEILHVRGVSEEEMPLTIKGRCEVKQYG